ncbi:MAG: hypothetical protein M1368_12650 [Thaumarchaeota archaeon]|nr:hypothetical protein [Nitrososphaerota archaeon]
MLVLSIAFNSRVASGETIPGPYPLLPSENEVAYYVNHLLNNYSSLVQVYSAQSTFPSYESNFHLYHDPSHTFEVIVLNCVPNNESVVCLIFVEVNGTTPIIVMDSQTTFLNLSMFALGGEWDSISSTEVWQSVLS